MTRKQYIISTILLILAGLVLLAELIRDCTRNGDFIGYLDTGNLVLAHKDIYSDILDTWPPTYSLFCVPLALADRFSSVLIRLAWLAGSILALYYTIRVTIQVVFNKPIVLTKTGNGIMLRDFIVVIPLVLVLRFIMDNLANLQINMFMLLLASLTVYYFIHNRTWLAGFLLALSISFKVYTIFLFFYFIYKREWAIVLKTFLFLLLINALPFFVFGFDGTLHYYVYWYKQIASNPPSSVHLNQSLFGLISRLVTANNPENDFYINFLSLAHPADTYIKYAVLLAAAIYPASLFKHKLAEKNNNKALLEYSFVFSIIPLASALAWKAYFIFLWFPYLLVYALLFRTPSTVKPGTKKLLRVLFAASIVLNVLTTDGIVGKHLSDILQSLSCITIGTILLVVIQLILYRNINKFEALARQ